MSKTRAFLWCWLPVLVWMAIIFTGSSDEGSFKHSSRIVAPLVRWLFPDVTDQTLHTVVIVVRKGAHLTEYAILALLTWRALRKRHGTIRRPWEWPVAWQAMLLVVLYAASDEFHQRFVPSREASVRDVMIDTAGGLGGLLILWVLGKSLGWWRAGEPKAS